MIFHGDASYVERSTTSPTDSNSKVHHGFECVNHFILQRCDLWQNLERSEQRGSLKYSSRKSSKVTSERSVGQICNLEHEALKVGLNSR